MEKNRSSRRNLPLRYLPLLYHPIPLLLVGNRKEVAFERSKVPLVCSHQMEIGGITYDGGGRN